MLCITGSEAVFADMGHFSHKSILVGALVSGPTSPELSVAALSGGVRVA